DRIWLEYPDTPAVVSTHFALSQQLFEKAPKAHELKAEEERRRRARGDGKDYRDRKAILPLKEEGAYLVIYLGENHLGQQATPNQPPTPQQKGGQLK
ncbi:MAG: hypothetical protein IZT59_08700, partial [Verrucomicrobia bacterium]|nr:hypothetical protein [Verrucomicrobiota bacterium]